MAKNRFLNDHIEIIHVTGTPAVVVKVEDQGTIVLFTPMNAWSAEWLKDNVQSEPWQMFGTAIAVDHRPAQGLVEFLQEQGATVTR